jgi:hypothetical protein
MIRFSPTLSLTLMRQAAKSTAVFVMRTMRRTHSNQ